ncbi:hypothetical protein C8J47_3267 [Sphingomonas sp. PP-F2F-G114-C0414]|nr:hypothetical protein C8J47_3267 [Sphingomonas sp. PP-F2F-G114-C0414]
MPSAIGIRGYLITVHRKGDPAAMVSFGDVGLNNGPREFITKFVTEKIAAVQDDERERSWYFEEREADGPGNSKGYVKYGTFGFESDFVNTKTKKRNYRRRTDDVEEIPLYYEFWSPETSDLAFAAFQSFQGRSCITMVMAYVKDAFEAANPGFYFRYRKLLPNDAGGSLYSGGPVKRLRLIKRNASGDVTDRYFNDEAPTNVDFEVRMTARRNKTLGDLASVAKSLTHGAAGVVMHDGIEFTQAIADVKIGGKYRPVGIFGGNTDAGVIDITGDVVRGMDGHPTFESLKKQCDDILKDFYEVLANKSS